jgi:DNA repair protein RecO (recombination protein O)
MKINVLLSVHPQFGLEVSVGIFVKGLVIKENNVGDNDKVLTILTDQAGLLRVWARGARRINSRLRAGAVLLTYGEYSLRQHKDSYSAETITVLSSFFELRQNLKSLALAAYFAEIAGFVVEESAGDDQVLRLILNALFLLVRGQLPTDQIKAVVEWRLARILGFMPDLVACRNCAEFKAPLFLDIQGGCILCQSCMDEQGIHGRPLSGTVLQAMRHILYGKSGKVFSFTIPEEDIQTLARLSEKYFLLHTDRSGFRTLRFYKDLAPVTEVPGSVPAIRDSAPDESGTKNLG